MKDKQVRTNLTIVTCQQMDALSRELSKKDDLLDDNGRQKNVLIEEVQCFEQQRFQNENQIKESRRQLAHVESLLESTQVKVTDYEQEVARLRHQLRFSNDKVISELLKYLQETTRIWHRPRN